MTRHSQMTVKYMGQAAHDPKDSLTNRLRQSAMAKRRKTMIASNVGELIELLSGMDKSARIYTIDPPFDGVKLAPQGDGAILICRPREPESKSAPAQLT